MKIETLPKPVEQFTITIDKNPAGKGGLLVMQWETKKATLRLRHDVVCSGRRGTPDGGLPAAS